MSVFRRSRFLGTCERCGNDFDPAYGGQCPACGKLLCPDHLYGSPWQRLRGMLGLRVECVYCRARK